MNLQLILNERENLSDIEFMAFYDTAVRPLRGKQEAGNKTRFQCGEVSKRDKAQISKNLRTWDNVASFEIE